MVLPNPVFKSVIVQNLKDTGNYYKFIEYSKHFVSKVEKDKQWFFSESGYRAVKMAQDKINKHISFDFDEDNKHEQKKIIILEIENTIWLVTKQQLPDWDDPMFTVTLSSSRKNTEKEVVERYIYVRRFGLEFLDFLWKTHDVILYTNLDRNLASGIIKAFQSIKKSIEFEFIIWGKPFWKPIYKAFRPIKSVDTIISEEDKERFIILDSESISYLEKYDDIYIPIIPILSSESNWKDKVLHTAHEPKRGIKLRGRKVRRR